MARLELSPRMADQLLPQEVLGEGVAEQYELRKRFNLSSGSQRALAELERFLDDADMSLRDLRVIGVSPLNYVERVRFYLEDPAVICSKELCRAYIAFLTILRELLSAFFDKHRDGFCRQSDVLGDFSDDVHDLIHDLHMFVADADPCADRYCLGTRHSAMQLVELAKAPKKTLDFPN